MKGKTKKGEKREKEGVERGQKKTNKRKNRKVKLKTYVKKIFIYSGIATAGKEI